MSSLNVSNVSKTGIVVAKLSSGDMVIGRLENDGSLRKVVGIVDTKPPPGHTGVGIGLIPLMQPFNASPIDTVGPEHIVCMTTIPEGLANVYMQQVSGIAVPTAKDVSKIVNLSDKRK